MATITSLFVTRLYRARLNDLARKKVITPSCAPSARPLPRMTRRGRPGARRNGYPGYTSYSSLNDLPWRSPVFADLEKALDKHVAAFCDDLGFDLQAAS